MTKARGWLPATLAMPRKNPPEALCAGAARSAKQGRDAGDTRQIFADLRHSPGPEDA